MHTNPAHPHRNGTSGAAGAVVALAVAAGLAYIGASALGRRRERQLGRVRHHPDSAPPRARRAQPDGPSLVGHAVTINRPRSELYAFWRKFENLPRFMSNVRRVEDEGGGRSRWTIAGPAGLSVEVHSEITEERDGERLAWRSLPDSAITAQGSVGFRDAPGGRGTIVEAEIAYDPPGGELGRMVAKLFQREPGIQGRRELKRFKMLMEAGEIATSANRKEDR
jgi:uncharacterized membrane protein